MTPYSRRADGRAVMRSSLRGAPMRSACCAACSRIKACFRGLPSEVVQLACPQDVRM